jgi:hypothetical protein
MTGPAIESILSCPVPCDVDVVVVDSPDADLAIAVVSLVCSPENRYVAFQRDDPPSAIRAALRLAESILRRRRLVARESTICLG